MAFAQAQRRPIAGAVATLGVSERVAFLRRTYAHLGIALIVWAALTAGIMRYATGFSIKFTMWAFGGSMINWIIVIAAFIGIGYASEKLATSQASRPLQYLGLGLAIVAQAFIVQPLLWRVIFQFGDRGLAVVNKGQLVGIDFAHAGPAFALIGQAAAITMAIFIGLTLTVFVTKKDFSFMRGALMIGAFAMLGIAICAGLFGFQLGIVWAAVGIALMAGFILYETSVIMKSFPPSYHVAAALMLFGTVATMFMYVLRLMSFLRSND